MTGLISATHTPMNSDGTLNLALVEQQAAHLPAHHNTAAFICGSTGEARSLSVDERKQMTHRWSEVLKGSSLKCHRLFEALRATGLFPA